MVHIFHYPLKQALPAISADALSVLDSYSFSTYAVGLRTPKEGKKNLLTQVRENLSQNSILKGKQFVLQHPDVEIVFDEITQQISIHIFPVIITGRYTKLQRTIAQTRHFCYECKGVGKKHGKICDVCHGEKVLTKESVQELITPFFQKEFTCNEVLFHGAGREDVDVRMLGNGRPFALTLENPQLRDVDIEKLRVHINHALKTKVELVDLKIGHPSDVARVMTTYHTKRYRALVESPEKINLNKLTPFLDHKMDVVQLTPLRVEKRRAMKERPHWIILEKTKRIADNRIEVELHSSAGCYIKEFISGDNGRSKPSLKEWLNVPCVCKELDVLEIVDVAH